MTVVASIVRSLPATTRTLVRQRQAFERLPASVRAGWAPAMPFSPTVIAFYALHLRPGDRFYVQAPDSGKLGNQRASLMLAAGYALLPHLMVSRPDEADVVLSFKANPRTLGLFYTSVDKLVDGISVARVAHVA
ncbi:MAG TPA: hypothetical protein VLV46_15215 [Gaiellaceae bacterium]|nr:hypothetical protein [Gaiellaceae bacterium]